MRRIGDHAVVVGGSVSGLFAARILSDAFDRVTVLERDPLEDEPVARRSVQHASHPHVLLEAGRATVEDLFPGYCEELVSAGGVLLDAATDVEYYEHGGYLADGPERLEMYSASRPLFEQVVRRRVADLDDVELRAGCRVTDYLVDDAGTAVEGVAFREESAPEEELAADLVVDATGRTSRTPTWLDDHGYRKPPVGEVDVDLAYATAVVERPPDDRRTILVTPSAPRTRGCGVVPIEGDRWLVSAHGFHGDHPPTDREGFQTYVASLPGPDLGRLLEERSWVSTDIDFYPFPVCRRRRYENLDRFPEGLVVLGDALTTFVPVYGQGMSVAALEALALHHALAAGGRDDLGPRFFERAEPIVDRSWKIAVGGTFQFSETEGPKPRGTDLFNWYESRLVRSAQSDGELADALFRTLRLEQSPTALLSPSVLWRVFSPRD